MDSPMPALVPNRLLRDISKNNLLPFISRQNEWSELVTPTQIAQENRRENSR